MPSSIRKALNELPTTLDHTYERALEGIPKEKSQHAHRLFQCLVAAVRPLRAEELAEIFAVDFDQDVISNLMEGWRPENPEDAVLSTCSTLISIIDDEGSKVVQFSHFSVKEFLTSDRLRTSTVGTIRDYHVTLDAAHTLLARACLAVLLQLDENVDKQRLEMFPLALYAAQHWVDHAKYEDVASRIQHAMEELFNPRKPYFAAWVWVYDVDWVYRQYLETPTQYPSPPEGTALYYAALCGFIGVVNHLVVKHGEDINYQSDRRGTPLHATSRSGHAEVAHVLLQHNADVNARSAHYFEWTPLHFASSKGHVKVVQLLLEHGADINAQSTSHSTPLKFASLNGRLEVVRLLLVHGADVHIRDEEGRTPFQCATMHQHVEVAQLLLERGAVEE
jgi:hypothetical protein